MRRGQPEDTEGVGWLVLYDDGDQHWVQKLRGVIDSSQILKSVSHSISTARKFVGSFFGHVEHAVGWHCGDAATRAARGPACHPPLPGTFNLPRFREPFDRK